MEKLNLLERKFKLDARLTAEQLREGQAFLAQEISDHLASGAETDSDNVEQYQKIIELLNREELRGNEAGSDVFTSFATTEIEEALRRVNRGEHIKYLLYRYCWHNMPHSFIIRKFPVHLAIESTSVCNLKCPMCFQTDPEFFAKKENLGNMSMDLFKKIIDEGVEKGLFSVKLSIRGEPMINRQLDEMVAYCRKQGVLDVMFNTNGTYLNDARDRALLAAEPHLIIFSIDSMNKERFERIRKKAKFEQVVGNVERFLEIKKNEYPNSITKTRVQMTVVPEAEQDIDELREYWKDKVDQVAIKKVLTRMHDTVVENTKPCRVLWQRMDIHFDGKVWLCDNDYTGKLLLGNVKTESVQDIWHKPQLNHLRELHQRGDKNTINPCKFCDGL